MFLTGFDSKPLSVLYVDKDMMYHDLLQAYSRTNRVEKETKPWGIIVCYRNLKQKTDDALALFSQGHPDGILTQPFEFYVQKFNELVTRIKLLAPTPASIDMMYSEDDQKEFVVLFRELTRYLLSLQTFVEFKFDRSNLDMTDQEYQDYKSKYLLLYRKNQTGKEVVSVFLDRNPLAKVEELLEDDYGMIDGIINNGDKAKEQERSKPSLLERLQEKKQEADDFNRTRQAPNKSRAQDHDLS